MRDCLVVLIWPQIVKEPVVREGDPASDNPGLCLHLGLVQLILMPYLTDGVDMFPFLTKGLLKKENLLFSCGGRERKFTPFIVYVVYLVVILIWWFGDFSSVHQI